MGPKQNIPGLAPMPLFLSKVSKCIVEDHTTALARLQRARERSAREDAFCFISEYSGDTPSNCGSDNHNEDRHNPSEGEHPDSFGTEVSASSLSDTPIQVNVPNG